jgi:beta-glucosidase
VHSAAGESATVELELDRRAFAYWDVERSDWTVTPGDYRVILGRDAVAVDADAVVTLVGDRLPRKLTMRSTLQEWFDHPIVGGSRLLETLQSDVLTQFAQPETLRVVGSVPMQKVVDTLGSTIPDGAVESLIAMAVQHDETAETDETQPTS